MCARHLDIPSEILPKSSLALIKQLTEARDRADFLEKETVNYLRLINREQIRQRQIEAFSSLSSLKVLYQGWADHTGMLDLVRRRKGSVLQIEKAAKELELFSERRTSQAITAEAICPGISERITNIYQKSRLLVSTSIQLQISNDKDLTSSMWKIVDELVNDIRELQAISGTAILSSISKQKL